MRLVNGRLNGRLSNGELGYRALWRTGWPVNEMIKTSRNHFNDRILVRIDFPAEASQFDILDDTGKFINEMEP